MESEQEDLERRANQLISLLIEIWMHEVSQKKKEDDGVDKSSD
jgi:hypothetical protein